MLAPDCEKQEGLTLKTSHANSVPAVEYTHGVDQLIGQRTPPSGDRAHSNGDTPAARSGPWRRSRASPELRCRYSALAVLWSEVIESQGQLRHVYDGNPAARHSNTYLNIKVGQHSWRIHSLRAWSTSCCLPLLRYHCTWRSCSRRSWPWMISVK